MLIIDFISSTITVKFNVGATFFARTKWAIIGKLFPSSGEHLSTVRTNEATDSPSYQEQPWIITWFERTENMLCKTRDSDSGICLSTVWSCHRPVHPTPCHAQGALSPVKALSMECIRVVPFVLAEKLGKRVQPAWSPPDGDYITGLKLYNSLTRKKVSFLFGGCSIFKMKVFLPRIFLQGTS